MKPPDDTEDDIPFDQDLFDDVMDALLPRELFEREPFEDDQASWIYIHPLSVSHFGIALLVFIQDRERPTDYHIILLRGIYE